MEFICFESRSSGSSRINQNEEEEEAEQNERAELDRIYRYWCTILMFLYLLKWFEEKKFETNSYLCQWSRVSSWCMDCKCWRIRKRIFTRLASSTNGSTHSWNCRFENVERTIGHGSHQSPNVHHGGHGRQPSNHSVDVISTPTQTFRHSIIDFR